MDIFHIRLISNYLQEWIKYKEFKNFIDQGCPYFLKIRINRVHLKQCNEIVSSLFFYFLIIELEIPEQPKADFDQKCFHYLYV